MAEICDVLCNELPNMASPSVRDDRKLEFLIEKEKERRRRETKKKKRKGEGKGGDRWQSTELTSNRK